MISENPAEKRPWDQKTKKQTKTKKIEKGKQRKGSLERKANLERNCPLYTILPFFRSIYPNSVLHDDFFKLSSSNRFLHIDSGAPIPRVSREFAITILAQSTRASLAALTCSSSAAISGTKR